MSTRNARRDGRMSAVPRADLLVLALGSTLAALLLAQAPALAAMALTGHVVDREGNPLADIEVVIAPVSDRSLPTLTARTNDKGIYTANPPKGEYTITVRSERWAVDRAKLHVADRDNRAVHDWEGKALPAEPTKIQIVHDHRIKLDLSLGPRQEIQAERVDQLFGQVSRALADGDRKKAFRTVEDLLKESPGDPLAITLRGYIHSEEGESGQAEADFKDALSRSPELDDALFLLGSLYAKTQRSEEAAPLFRKAAEVSKRADLRGKAWLMLADVDRAAGRDEKAAEDLENALEALPSLAPEVAPELAQIYTRLGQPESAEAALLRLGGEGRAPADARVIYNLGVEYFKKSDWDKAIAQFQRAVAADPQLAEAHRSLGFAQVNKGDKAGAVASLERFLELRQTGPEADEARRIVEMLKKAAK